jgi:hypothetical protein
VVLLVEDNEVLQKEQKVVLLVEDNQVMQKEQKVALREDKRVVGQEGLRAVVKRLQHFDLAGCSVGSEWVIGSGLANTGLCAAEWGRAGREGHNGDGRRSNSAEQRTTTRGQARNPTHEGRSELRAAPRNAGRRLRRTVWRFCVRCP